MRAVYIAHPLGPDGPEREKNRENAARWVALLSLIWEIAPLADWIILSGEWRESPELRAIGIAIDLELVARADEVWLVGGCVSGGMRAEADRAMLLGKVVRDLTAFGREAPINGSGDPALLFALADVPRREGPPNAP